MTEKLSETGAWSHLERPFAAGQVIPSNRSPGEWHFTFRCALGETYYERTWDIKHASDAKLMMRRFCARNGCRELEQYLDSAKHPFVGGFGHSLRDLFK